MGFEIGLAILMMLSGMNGSQLRYMSTYEKLSCLLRIPVIICFLIFLVYFIKHPYVLKSKLRKSYFWSDPRFGLIISFAILILAIPFSGRIRVHRIWYYGMHNTFFFFSKLILCIYTIGFIFNGKKSTLDLTYRKLDEEEAERKKLDDLENIKFNETDEQDEEETNNYEEEDEE